MRGGKVAHQRGVVGHEEDGAGELAQSVLQLLDGRQVQMVGGLIEDQSVDRLGLKDGKERAGRAFRRRP